MEFSQILEALSRPEAYPHPVEAVEVRQTHISAVFLAGPYAYKIKKPRDLGFLDFTTLEKRRHFCLEEVKLNRRLAPHTYLGVVPLSLRSGELRVDAPGEVVEWAVWMERLPDEAMLSHLLADGSVGREFLAELGRRVARFHQSAERGSHVARFGTFPVVARNARENFEQCAAHAGQTVSPEVYGRVSRATEEGLLALRGLIEERARRGVPCDTHGDLHLEHIYCLPDGQSPQDVVIVDCIEFNERFRYADPVCDVAFLAMDLSFSGRPDLRYAFTEAYFEAAADREGARLLPSYVAYRSVVRAKVEGFKAFEPEIPGEDRVAALRSARAHWLLALVELEPPERKPCLILAAGLPGTGKSAVARGLAARAGFRVISSDLVRKELAGLAASDSAASAFETGIYTREWNDRTYAECLGRAEAGLSRGERVVVDATFREEGRRQEFLDLARRSGVPALVLLRTAGSELVRDRLARRQDDDSDADWSVYVKAAEAWEAPGEQTLALLREVPAAEDKHKAAEAAVAVLRADGLA